MKLLSNILAYPLTILTTIGFLLWAIWTVLLVVFMIGFINVMVKALGVKL